MADTEKALRQVGHVLRVNNEAPNRVITPAKLGNVTPVIGPSKFDDRGDWSWMVGRTVDVPNRTRAHEQLVRKIQALNVPGIVEVPKSIDIVVHHDSVEVRKFPVGEVDSKKLRKMLGAAREKSAGRDQSASAKKLRKIFDAAREKSAGLGQSTKSQNPVPRVSDTGIGDIHR